MLKAFVFTGFLAIIFLGCALEDNSSESAPAPSEDTTWIPEQK